MTVKELQKILQTALTYFTKYKPSDLVLCDVEEEYTHNYWNAPYMTVTNGDYDRCGISLSNKSRGGANKIVTSDDYEETLEEGDDESPDRTFEIRNIKRILTDAIRVLKEMDPEAQVKTVHRSEGLEKPFVCLYDNNGDFLFVSLNHLEVEQTLEEPIEETMTNNDMYVNHKFNESKTITFRELKRIVCESIDSKREIFECADIWLEEQIRMDNPNYTFEKMRAYASGKKQPDYKEIVRGILDNRFTRMSEETENDLREFLDSSFLTDYIVAAIDSAIEQQSASLDMFA